MRADAGQIAGAERARAAALEQSQADLRTRTYLVERKLEAARRQVAELGDALARAESRAEATADEVDRDALVAELAAGIRAAAGDGDKWRPDYDGLMERTGRQRRWCEYLVRDARSAVFGSSAQAPADGSPEPADGPARAGPRAEPGVHAYQLASANGHRPQDPGGSIPGRVTHKPPAAGPTPGQHNPAAGTHSRRSVTNHGRVAVRRSTRWRRWRAGRARRNRARTRRRHRGDRCPVPRCHPAARNAGAA